MIFFYLLIAIMPLSDHHFWGRSFGGLTMFKALGAICLVYAVIHLASNPRKPAFFNTWQARLSILFFFGSIVSFFVAAHGKPSGLDLVWNNISFAVFFITVVSLVDSLHKLRWTLLWTVGSTAFASLYVIREWWQFRKLFGSGFRPGGATGDSNYYALTALMGVLVAYYLFVERRDWWDKLFALGCLSITLVGLSIASSRGGFLGMIAAFTYIVWRSSHRMRNSVIAAILVLPLSVLSPVSPINRLLHPAYADNLARDARTTVWRAGIKMIKSHPFLGIGAGQFKPQVETYEMPEESVRSLAHNTYIEIAAEMGVPVLLIFIGILVGTFRTLEKVRRQTLAHGPKLLQLSAVSLQASLIGYATGMFFLTAQYQKHLWFMVFLSVALKHLQRTSARRRLSAKASTAADPRVSVGQFEPQYS